LKPPQFLIGGKNRMEPKIPYFHVMLGALVLLGTPWFQPGCKRGVMLVHLTELF
jgi:hypothetical protein